MPSSKKIGEAFATVQELGVRHYSRFFGLRSIHIIQIASIFLLMHAEAINLVPIKREKAEELSLDRFVREYVTPGVPVIIEHSRRYRKKWRSLKLWDEDYISKRCHFSTW